MATQAPVRGHETPSSSTHGLEVLPGGFSVLVMIQAFPFQASASDDVAPDGLTVYPTAMHALVDEQETEANVLSSAPATSGELWTRHDRPSQPSTSVLSLPLAAK